MRGFDLPVPEMSAADSIKNWLLHLELRCTRPRPLLHVIPRPLLFKRRITADFTLLASAADNAVRFRIDFRSPYFRLPVSVEKSQVGRVNENGMLDPASFRFFDWHSWTHMDGRIEWVGERRLNVDGVEKSFINGFIYTPTSTPPESENLGVRVAEGVIGTVRILTGAGVAPFGFDPGYWMLEPDTTGYKVVAIRNPELMVLIVSLSELGSGTLRLRKSAVEHLCRWVSLKLGGRSKERMLLTLLRYVRDWGPLGLEPLYSGLKEVLLCLELTHQEQVIFEFFADNWGIHNNWHGRLLAIKMLEALATERAESALFTISHYLRNRPTETEELDLIRRVISRIAQRAPAAGSKEPPAI